MRHGRSWGFRAQYGEKRGDALAVPDGSHEKAFTVPRVGASRRPMPRRKGRFFRSEGLSTSINERVLRLGCDPSSRIACRAIERRDPTLQKGGSDRRASILETRSGRGANTRKRL